MVTPRSLRVAFFGTPAFAVPTLEALRASRHVVAGVVTQPDRPRGRGHKTSSAPVKAAATAAGLPLLQPARLRDEGFLDTLAAWNTDIGVVAAYGRILTDTLLGMPPLGMVNVHASLLPRYRGAAPVHRAVLAGDRETGVTIMRVVKALDAGPMLAWTRRSIGPDETSTDVERDLAQLGAQLLVATLDRLSAGDVPATTQDDAAVTYAPRITREDGAIDWRRPATELHNQVRGLHPWPHASSSLDDRRRLIILRSRAVESTSTAEPGTIVEAHGETILVATGRGALALLELQLEGGRAMPARQFLAGHAIAPGTKFSPAA
jgi:methionyl-tRNA formyltransferase